MFEKNEGKKKMKLALELMTYPQLMTFHSWFFGHDREYMIEHILENSEDAEKELKNYSRQAEQDWLKELI